MLLSALSSTQQTLPLSALLFLIFAFPPLERRISKRCLGVSGGFASLKADCCVLTQTHGHHYAPFLRERPAASSTSECPLCALLFQICLNALFSLSVPVALAFYLICPKHTSLMGAAGCVRGSVSLPPK